VSGDLRKILSNTLWMIFDKVFLLVLNLVVTVKIANYFGVMEYGNYQYAVSVVTILEILVAFVDGRVVKKRYIYNDPGNLVYNATICRVIFSVGTALIGLIFIIVAKRGNQFSIMFSILLINSILVNLRFGMANRFEYLLKSKKTVIAADISALLSSILQLTVVQLQGTIITISVIATVSSGVNLCIVAIQYKNEFANKTKLRLDKKLIKDLIKESTPLAIAASCATIYTRCDSVMLGSMMTATEVGIYSISVKLISVVQIAILPIRESVYPKLISLYTKDKNEYARRYIQISSLLTWIYICGVTLSFIILPYAFRILKPEYAEAFQVYKIHVIGTFFMYNAGLRAGHYTLISRGSILTYSQIASVIVNVVLNIVGIKYLGMYGAALATIITQGLSLFVSNLVFGKDGREIFMWQVKAINPLSMR